MDVLQQYVGRDCISELPEHILVCILSFLDTKDAVRTSALSRQWRYIWLLSPPHLKFDQSNIFGSNHSVNKFDNEEVFRSRRSLFVKRVDHIIDQYKKRGVGSVRSLEVNFFMDSQRPASSSLDSWIRFAIQSGSEKVELLLSNFPYLKEIVYLPEATSYHVPQWLFSESTPNRSTLKHLSLERCSVNNCHGDFGGLRNLTTLKLDGVYIGDGFMRDLLSTSLLLRELTLVECYFPASSLHLISSSVMYLRLQDYKQLYDIKIAFPNLTTFTFMGLATSLSLIEAPSLSRLSLCSLDLNYDLNLIASLPQLESLAIVTDDFAAQSMPERTNVNFTSLKVLELQFHAFKVAADFSLFPAVVKASPLLQKLVLMCPLFPQKEANQVTQKMENADGFVHKQLKDVEIGALHGLWYEIEIATFLLEVAATLERMVVTPIERFLHPIDGWLDFGSGDYSTWYTSQRDIVHNLLKEKIRPGVQFTLL